MTEATSDEEAIEIVEGPRTYGMSSAIGWHLAGAFLGVIVMLSLKAIHFNFGADDNALNLFVYLVVAWVFACFIQLFTGNLSALLGLTQLAVGFVSAYLMGLGLVGWIGLYYGLTVLAVSFGLAIAFELLRGGAPSRVWLFVHLALVTWGTWFLYVTEGPLGS